MTGDCWWRGEDEVAMRFFSCSFLCPLCQLARRSGEACIGMGISKSMPDGRSENKKRMNGWVGWKKDSLSSLLSWSGSFQQQISSYIPISRPFNVINIVMI